MSEYNEDDFTKYDDPLAFIYDNYYPKIILSHFWPYKILRHLTACYLSFYCAYGVNKMLLEKNTKFTQQYMPSLFYIGSMVSMYILVNLFEDRLLGYQKILKRTGISLSLSSSKNYHRILKDCDKIKTYCKFTRVFMFVVACAFFPILGDEEEWQIAVYFIENFFEGTYKIFFCKLFLCLSYVLCAYMFMIPSLIYLYVTCNVQFRYEVLNELMENLLEEGEIDDADFQRKIFLNLKLCVMVHNQNKRLACRMLDLTGAFTLGICLVSIVAFAALSFFILTNISPKSNIRIMVSSIVNILALLILCQNSDKLYVVTSKLFENGINCPWWNWNKENQKILLIFLINASRPIRINGFNIVDANYELILRILKAGYGTLNIFITMRNKE